MHCSTRRTGRRVGVMLLVVATTAALGVGVASASGTNAIEVKRPWARTSPMEASNGAVYMILKNGSSSDQALVGASVPASVAAEVQIHETAMGSGDSTGTMAGGMGSTPTTMAGGMGSSSTTMAGGMGGSTMTMREVDQIMIPADSVVKLEPGGYHIMLIDLAKPLETGSRIRVTLEFESGKTMTVRAVVKK